MFGTLAGGRCDIDDLQKLRQLAIGSDGIQRTAAEADEDAVAINVRTRACAAPKICTRAAAGGIAHVVAARGGKAEQAPKRIAASKIKSADGGGMSRRMLKEVREAQNDIFEGRRGIGLLILRDGEDIVLRCSTADFEIEVVFIEAFDRGADAACPVHAAIPVLGRSRSAGRRCLCRQRIRGGAAVEFFLVQRCW